MGRNQYSSGKSIGDYPILVAETIAIREAALVIIQKRLTNVIIESDSQMRFGPLKEKLRL